MMVVPIIHGEGSRRNKLGRVGRMCSAWLSGGWGCGGISKWHPASFSFASELLCSNRIYFFFQLTWKYLRTESKSYLSLSPGGVPPILTDLLLDGNVLDSTGALHRLVDCAPCPCLSFFIVIGNISSLIACQRTESWKSMFITGADKPGLSPGHALY